MVNPGDFAKESLIVKILIISLTFYPVLSKIKYGDFNEFFLCLSREGKSQKKGISIYRKKIKNQSNVLRRRIWIIC